MMATRSRLENGIAALAAVLALALLIQEVPRILFPWDLRMFSESTLLTNMMKLTAGEGPYTSVGDANSFIYAPGLDYVTFAILRPFGAQLDVRACRAVTVLIGLAAAGVAGWVCARLATLRGTSQAWIVRVASSCIATLVIFKSYTSDACHPDNLYILHAMALIALSYTVIQRRSLRHAFAAVVLAALGVLVKQTAGMSVLGLALLLLIYCRSWGWTRFAALVGCGARASASRLLLFTVGGEHGRSTCRPTKQSSSSGLIGSLATSWTLPLVCFSSQLQFRVFCMPR